MTIETPVTTGLQPSGVPIPGIQTSAVQWAPIFLGAVGAAAVSMVLLTFGSGIGLSAVSAQPYAGASAKAIAVCSAIYLAITVVGSFAIGGYLAGRLRRPTEAVIDERHFRDGAHGFGVWAVGILLGGMIAVSGVTGLTKAVGEAATSVAAAGTAGAASNPAIARGVGQSLSTSPTDYAVDRLLAPAPQASAAPPAPAPAPAATPPTPDASGTQAGGATTTPGGPMGGPAGAAMAPMRPAPAASRADVAAPIGRAFATSLRTGQLDPRDRAMLVQTVMRQTGLPQPEAEKRVDDAYNDLKAAEQQVRDAAEKARKVALITAFAAAATLLLGCAAAAGGASAGGHHRDENVVIRVFGTSRFW